MTHEWEGMWKEVVWSNLKYYSIIHMKILRKATEFLRYETHSYILWV
jgi:hypothetical protein